jgi:hypothetical protein
MARKSNLQARHATMSTPIPSTVTVPGSRKMGEVHLARVASTPTGTEIAQTKGMSTIQSISGHRVCAFSSLCIANLGRRHRDQDRDPAIPDLEGQGHRGGLRSREAQRLATAIILDHRGMWYSSCSRALLDADIQTEPLSMNGSLPV